MALYWFTKLPTIPHELAWVAVALSILMLAFSTYFAKTNGRLRQENQLLRKEIIDAKAAGRQIGPMPALDRKTMRIEAWAKLLTPLVPIALGVFGLLNPILKPNSNEAAAKNELRVQCQGKALSTSTIIMLWTRLPRGSLHLRTGSPCWILLPRSPRKSACSAGSAVCY